MKKSDPPIIIEQLFNTDIATIWEAITEVEQMRKWFFGNIPAFEPKTGYSTQFYVQNDGRTFPHQWKILEVTPYKKISYDWRYEGYSGVSLVTFELEDFENKVRLILSNTVVEDFDSSIPEFTTGSCVAGWNYFINQQLKKYIEGKL